MRHSLGKQVKLIRNLLEMTSAQLGEDIGGKSASYILRIESGNVSNPSFDTVNNIIQVFIRRISIMPTKKKNVVLNELLKEYCTEDNNTIIEYVVNSFNIKELYLNKYSKLKDIMINTKKEIDELIKDLE